MTDLMVYIEDQIRDVYQRVSLDVDTSADLLVTKLVRKFGLPRYNFNAQQIEYWLERPDEKKRSGRGIRLPGHITLREAGIRRGDLLQLVSPEGRRVWILIQKILDEITKEITDKASEKLKEKVAEKVWERVKKKLAEIERTRADDKRVQWVRRWVNSVEKIRPMTLMDIIEKSLDVYKRYGPLAKAVVVLTPVLLIILATLLPPSSAEPPVTTIVSATATPSPSPSTIPAATLTSTPTPATTSTPMPTSRPTSSPTTTASPVVNHTPVADSQSISIDQDTTANITLIARDEDGFALTFNIVSNPSNGTLSGELPNLIYTPHRGFSGFDSFTFKANDGQADSNIAMVNIAVRANTPPVANDDIATTDQDMAISINVLANDFDSDGDPLTVISVTQGSSGTVINDGYGIVTYKPQPGFIGQDTFTYTTSDSKAVGSATVLVTVKSVLTDLAVTQTDSLDPLAIGDDLTYEIRIINHGPAAATGVTVSDLLPSIALLRSATPSQGTCSQEKGIVTCQIGNLAAAAEATIRIAVTMGQGEDQARVVTNIVEVSGNQADPEPANNTSREATTINLPDSADLVITTFQTTGPGIINAEGQIEVPIRLIVKNQGGTEAGIFKVSTEYTGPNGTFVVAFTVPGQRDIWYPYTNAPLAAGDEVTFAGAVTFRGTLAGETVSVRSTADSCSGDEFMPDYCRVEESNEGNNDSAPISVSLPSSLPPEVEIINPKTDTGPSDDEYAYDGYDQDLKLWYTDVVLQGSATDPEDGPLNGSSLVWTTDRSDIQSATLDFGTNVTARLYSNVCTGVLHEIALTATDSTGKESRAIRKIWIWTLC
jgi:uncharacterized repeat protein (TIGR01451 family)